MTSPPLVLRPNRTVTGVWTLISATATALALGSAVAAPDSLFVWTLGLFCVVVTAAIGSQAAMPSWFEVVVDERGIRVRHPWQRITLEWRQVHLARISRVLGEQLLECWISDPGSDRPTRTVAIHIPLGSDVSGLRKQLEHHIGLADPGLAHTALG